MVNTILEPIQNRDVDELHIPWWCQNAREWDLQIRDFFKELDVTYRHSDTRAYYMVGIYIRKKNTITMKSLENASFNATTGLLFLL